MEEIDLDYYIPYIISDVSSAVFYSTALKTRLKLNNELELGNPLTMDSLHLDRIHSIIKNIFLADCKK